MTNANIYKDIAKRTQGDIYIGVVGPVRSGKSTFIKRFMEEMVLPNITDYYDKQRTVDVMPQSADGRAVMTTEPKFIPDDAVRVNVGNNILNIKMIDCVGYLIPDAITNADDGKERMVNTPWSEEPMLFSEAAELGTQKVICDHSTIAFMVTTDGSIGEIPRESYEEAEARVIAELEKNSRPYAIILNSKNPSDENAIKLAYELEKKYKAPVALINCLQLDSEDIEHILALTLEQFPMLEMKFSVPSWAKRLPHGHWLKKSLTESVRELADSVEKMGDVAPALENLTENPNIKDIKVKQFRTGDGVAELEISLADNLYYRVLSELTGLEITDDAALVSIMQELSATKREYDKVAEAIAEVNETGYGIVMPGVDELRLQEPEIIKQSGSYGVKLRAAAQSIHMIRANIETEINPIVGTEEQSEEMVRYLLQEFEEDPKKIWDSNMFGKSLYELINDGLHSKLEHMPEESRAKLSETLERIINEGSGGLICILL